MNDTMTKTERTTNKALTHTRPGDGKTYTEHGEFVLSGGNLLTLEEKHNGEELPFSVYEYSSEGEINKRDFDNFEDARDSYDGICQAYEVLRKAGMASGIDVNINWLKTSSKWAAKFGDLAMKNFDAYIASPEVREAANAKISALFAEYSKIDKGPKYDSPEYDTFMDKLREVVEELATEILGDVPLKVLDPVESNEVMFDGVAKVKSHFYNFSSTELRAEKVVIEPTYFDCFLLNCAFARQFYGREFAHAIHHPFHQSASVNECGDGTAIIEISNGS